MKKISINIGIANEESLLIRTVVTEPIKHQLQKGRYVLRVEALWGNDATEDSNTPRANLIAGPFPRVVESSKSIQPIIEGEEGKDFTTIDCNDFPSGLCTVDWLQEYLEEWYCESGIFTESGSKAEAGQHVYESLNLALMRSLKGAYRAFSTI